MASFTSSPGAVPPEEQVFVSSMLPEEQEQVPTWGQLKQALQVGKCVSCGSGS